MIDPKNNFSRLDPAVERILDEGADRGVTIPSLARLTPRERLQAVLPALLRPYQLRFLNDKSPLRLVIKARQIGISFAAALDVVLKGCLDRPPHITVISATQRHSNEFGEKTRVHFKAMEQLVLGGTAQPLRDNVEMIVVGEDAKVTATHCKIMFMSCSSNSARSFTGHAVLDELASFQRAYDIYTAITGQLTLGFTNTAISTPAGDIGLFYELVQRTRRGDWDVIKQGDKARKFASIHEIDIYQAIREGWVDRNRRPVDPQIIRANCLDEDTFQQEYCLAFLSDEGRAIPADLVRSCIQREIPHRDAVLARRGIMEPEPWPEKYEYYIMGIDIGRYRDRTVIAVLGIVGDDIYTVDLNVLHKVEYSQQFETIDTMALRYKPLMINMDEQGIGNQLAEDVQKKYGRGRVNRCSFRPEEKVAMISTWKDLATKKFIHLPGYQDPESKSLELDFGSIRRHITPGGTITFQAEHNDKGHADRAWAHLLAVVAASNVQKRRRGLRVQSTGGSAADAAMGY